MRILALSALALVVTGCAVGDGVPDDSVRAASLAQIDVSFTRDGQGLHFGAQGYFARFRVGEFRRTATLLGLGQDEQIALDSCRLVDGAEELDRAFHGGSADVELLDAGRLLVRGPGHGAQLQRLRYPNLTPEVTGVVYSSEEAPELTLEPGASYELVGEGGEQVGPFGVSVTAPRSFPTLVQPVHQRGGDLELRWAEPGERAEPVLLSIAWVTRTGAREIRCRVRDTGAYTVAAPLLAALPPASQANARIEVTTTRLQRRWFAAPGVDANLGQVTLALRDVATLTIQEAP